MALPKTETFTASNNTQVSAISGWAKNTSGDCDVQTNSATSDRPGQETCNLWTGDGAFNNDQYSEGTIVALSTTSQLIGVAVRCASGAETYYGAYQYQDGAGAYLFKQVAGSWTQLDNAVNAAVSSVIRLEAEGTALTATDDGGAWLSATDSAIASGYAGICGYDDNTVNRIDDVVMGNLGSTATTLTVADTYTTTQADAVVLKYSKTLAPTDAFSTTQTDAVIVNEVGGASTLTLADTHVTTQADAVTVSKSDTLAVVDAFSTTQTDALTLTYSTTLAVADTHVTTQADAVTVSKSDTLAVVDAFSTTQTDAINLSGAGDLVVADVYSVTQTDALTLTYSTTLAVADTHVTTQTDAIILTQAHYLSVADAYCVTQSDVIQYSSSLSVDDVYAVTYADPVVVEHLIKKSRFFMRYVVPYKRHDKYRSVR